MRPAFFDLPVSERNLVFEQAAIRRGVSTVIVEKDYWVCWLLKVLYESTFKDVLVFKGGTSLSKVFGAIGRFSEDIDLSLAPEFLGLSEVAVAGGTSRTQANKWMKNAEAACSAAVSTTLQPELERLVTETLGLRKEQWLEFVVDPSTNSPLLLFHYPTMTREGFEYLRRFVKLEFGSLTDQRPIGVHAVRPWIADEFPAIFADWQANVVALELERTFWEKATILHAEHHRPSGSPIPARFSRHYSDLAALVEHASADAAIQRDDLRERVVAWKSKFFGSAWARYDLARTGTFRGVPPKSRGEELKRDYFAMRDMFLSEPPEFGAILITLESLENRINSTLAK